MSAPVILTGAAGQLAAAILEEFAAGYDVIPLSHSDLDITSADDVSARVTGSGAGVVINCAAYNRVDEAEDSAAEALEVNALAVRHLARAAAAAHATLVHYSTDFVFDGRADRPYVETDRPEPPNVYAMSKLVGEWLARDAPRFYVLRVESLFGGPNRTSSIDRIIASILEGRETRVFADRTISPSYTPDVAMATRRLIESNAAPGLYHCVNSGSATWLELAREASRLLAREGHLVSVPMDDVPLRARRPKYSALSNQKLLDAGIAMPHWREALERHVAAINFESRDS
jgi:dTDP-4-dehydrorhamnose reductase